MITPVRKCFSLPTTYPARLQRLLFCNRGRRHAAEQRDQVSADTAPVGSACMRFAADHREQVRGDTPPGANRGEQVLRRSARRSNHWAEIAHNFYRPEREKTCACWARRAGDNIGKQCRHKNGEFCAIGGILRSVKKRLLFLRGCAKIYCCKNIRMSVLLKEV